MLDCRIRQAKPAEAIMASTALISIICADRTGLIAAITGRLYDLGANLGDTTFAVLGGGAEFTTICELPDGLSLEAVERDLGALPELAGARLKVRSFGFQPVHGPTARVTHRIKIVGDDSPGLIARLSEVFVGFGANIVRLNSERIPGGSGAKYLSRLDVSIPEGKAESCLATVANTAGELRLSCKWTPA